MGGNSFGFRSWILGSIIFILFTYIYFFPFFSWILVTRFFLTFFRTLNGPQSKPTPSDEVAIVTWDRTRRSVSVSHFGAF